MLCHSASIVVGPTPWRPDELTQHIHQVPAMFDRWRQVLLTRSPLTRIPSLYRHFARYEPMPPWQEWLRTLVVPESAPLSMVSPASHWCPHASDFIRTEHLSEDLLRVLGETVTPVRLNASTGCLEVTPEDSAIIADLYRVDIEREVFT